MSKVIASVGDRGRLAARLQRRTPTATGPAARPAPDLVHRRFQTERPDQLRLANITDVPTWEGWLFLAVVMDSGRYEL